MLFVMYEIVEWEIISKSLTKCRKLKLSVYLTGTLYLYDKNLPSNVCEHRREVPRTSGNTVLVWVFARFPANDLNCSLYRKYQARKTACSQQDLSFMQFKNILNVTCS